MQVLKDKIIYVIDDDSVHLEMMRFMLRRIGFVHIETFADAESAFEHMQIEKPNVIISDWNMDPVDGLQLLKMVRLNDFLTEVPFIIVTANTSEHYWRDAIMAGVTEFLFKPLNFDVFREAVMIALDISDEQPNLEKLQIQHAITRPYWQSEGDWTK